MPLLELKNLSVAYRLRQGYLMAVDQVSMEVNEGEVLGIAGESGCGKSTVALSVLRILPKSARVTGTVAFGGEDVLTMGDERVRAYRWKHVALVPQGSMNAFDPVISVGAQIVEAIKLHEGARKEEAWKRARELFGLVGIPKERVTNYPHELSGGMKQRAAIAMALSLSPRLVILDEPTTALDVVVQKQILSLLVRLKRELSVSFMFITHDLSVLAEVATRVAVMYAGKLVEVGPAEVMFRSPSHPYTQALMQAIPNVHGDISQVRSIPGTPPDLTSLQKGCRFSPRCPYSFGRCTVEEPQLSPSATGSMAACHLVGG
jgi:peptide/nickel transport system ATP-binding protein